MDDNVYIFKSDVSFKGNKPGLKDPAKNNNNRLASLILNKEKLEK